ncbi:BTAD domain-containing putative transcriptional regulator [Streptomyces sp. Ac-502]|uniref:AfsR/SARP family transcriptional regulator n=1 Tax=Streptomyces sp. Ac-502 TaxID=3342801 RepID=UPI003862D2F0
MADGVGDQQHLWFTVLGPVGIWRGTQRLDAGSPQQRALLAMLLLRVGWVASVPDLIDAMWGQEPPATAVAALRTYASRLRKALGSDADMVVSESGGYVLRIGESRLDLDVAERLSTEAEREHRCGRPGRARELLLQALDLWTGDALTDAPGPYCAAQRARLEERRLALLESRLDLDLEIGRHAEAVAELTALTAAHPLRERLRELLMLALYRGGRQAEALATFDDTRRLLADELGTDPGPNLSELHQRILRADPDLLPPPGKQGVGGVLLRPAQLPADLSDFTGRSRMVKELARQLTAGEGQGIVVSATSGIGGVGKTALSVHVAHRVRPHFPDGQLYVDLQGVGPAPAEPGAVLGGFLRALGLPDVALPREVSERAALYRSALDGRRILILLDNARDAAQVRSLLPGTQGCAVLVSSRTRMTGLAGAHQVELDVMDPQDALALFTRITGRRDEANIDVVAACGFLPLALRIAATRLATRRSWTVADLARKLADERSRLDELCAGDLTVTASFELGYRNLPAQQARAFHLLSLPDGPDISLTAAAAVLGLSPVETRRLLEPLVDASLLESTAPDRYCYHDLVRLYARTCAERDASPDQREAAMSRLLDFYLSTAAQEYVIERPGDPILDHLEPTQWPGLSFESRDTALEWLFSEARNLLACARASGHRSALRRAADLMFVAKDLAETGAHAPQYTQVNAHLLNVARPQKDAQAEGRLHCPMVNVHVLAGRFEEAEQAAQAALAFRLHCTDPVLSAHALNESAILASVQRQYENAEQYQLQALEVFRHYGNHNSEASALNNLARVYLETGRVAQAVKLCEQALAIYHAIGATLRLANGKYTLGLALARAGRPEEALEQMNQALLIFQSNRHRLWEALAYWRMSEMHLAASRPVQAAGLAEHALATLHSTGSSWIRAKALTTLGHALRRTKHTDRARACWREALTLYAQLGSPDAANVRSLLSA